MSGLDIRLRSKPFARWWGPYSPARGTKRGFRFHDNQLGVWHDAGSGLEFWTVQENAAVRGLTKLVLGEWGGGRLLFLPNGYIVKPLPGRDEDRCKRVVLGTFAGPLVLESPAGDELDLSDPWTAKPGDDWEGPSTIGLEVVMDERGALRCDWYHPDSSGRLDTWTQISGADASMVRGFRATRRIESAGRVHITPNGHIITNCNIGFDRWRCRYVGFLGPRAIGDWSKWIG